MIVRTDGELLWLEQEGSGEWLLWRKSLNGGSWPIAVYELSLKAARLRARY